MEQRINSLKYIKLQYQLRYLVPMPIKLPIDKFNGFPTLMKRLGYKVGAEIGTAKGHFAKWLCVKIPKLKLFCIDPYKVYEGYVEYKEGDQLELDSKFEEAKTKLAKFNVEFVRKYSMDAVKDFPDNSLDFVYIDANHSFEYVVSDIAEWERKVRQGGIISGHDYWNSQERNKIYKIGIAKIEPTEIEKMKLCQVKDAVDAWTKTNKIKPWFLTNERDYPSWFYIKQ